MATSIAEDDSETELDSPLPSVSASIRELLTIAIPLTISTGSVMLMHVANRIFLTRYSQEALAAVTPSAMWNWTLLSIFIGTCQYVNTFVSQYEGAKRPDRVAAAIWQGAYFAIGGGLLLVVIAPFTSGIFGMFNHAPRIERLEVQYFQIVCLGSPAVLLASVMGCFYSGRQFTRITMIVNTTGSLINIVLDYLLIFGNGPFPELGMAGAAWATVIAECCMLVIYLGILWFDPDATRYRVWSSKRFDRDLFHRLLKFGLPSGFHFFIDVFAFTVLLFVIGMLGKNALAATNLAFSLNSMAFLPMLGMGTAVSILVGKRIGAGHPDAAVRTTWIAFWISAMYMLIFSAIYLGSPDWLLSLYAVEENAVSKSAVDFEEMRPLIIQLLWYVAVYSLFDAMAIIFGSALRGAGDTRFVMAFSFACSWIVMLIPTWIGITQYEWGLFGAWAACTANVIIAGLGLVLRFQQGKWRSMRVIEAPPPPDVD